jgi:chlorobactene glucosyltransferase
VTLFSAALPIVLAMPWVVLPLATALRVRRSRSLDEYPSTVLVPGMSDSAPVVSLVIPARNEARNIERCVRSALLAEYPRLEIIAVDDHSTDATGDILRTLADEDARLRVVTPEPLPSGWFGKQWACAAGFAQSRGDVIGFMDADTCQAPDLVPRIVNAMAARDADLLTVGGRQELGSFWERLIQPQVFAIMAARYGSTEAVNGARHARSKIANGQCIFVRREAYVELGGHGAVREKVAEDLALAQLYFLRGKRTVLLLGTAQLTTRMYTSLRELIDGWGKNLYAGGRDAMPFRAAGRAIYPLLLISPALSGLIPPLLLLLAALGVCGHGVLLWSAIVTAANLAWWAAVYRWMKYSPAYALLHPVGAAALLYITVRSIVRGKRVQWRGREYILS